jgi:hypothetical protein
MQIPGMAFGHSSPQRHVFPRSQLWDNPPSARHPESLAFRASTSRFQRFKFMAFISMAFSSMTFRPPMYMFHRRASPA